MNKNVLKCISVCFTLILLFGSCEQIDIEDIKNDIVETSNVKIITRAETDIVYPLTLIAFDKASAEIVSHTKQNSAANTISLNLPKGTYKFIAISGIELPDNIDGLTLEDIMEMSDGYTETPLIMGSADTNIKSDASVNISMYNVVTALSFNLSEIPDNIENVDITLSDLYSSINFNGEYANAIPVTIACVKNNDKWITPTVYTFPSPNKKVVLSITMTDKNDNTQTYGYTYNSAIEANTPYSFTGNYIQGFTVNGTISINGWNEPKSIEFTFGKDNENDSDTYYTDNLPFACSMWNGHFVAYSEINEEETEADIMLLSLQEWDDIPSIEYTGSKAESLANSYSEDNITNWHVPTSEEVNIMKEYCGGDNFDTMNDLITSNNGIIVTAEGQDTNKNSLRYLCEELQKTYSWKSGSKISDAGLTRTYNIRFIKWIKLTKN